MSRKLKGVRPSPAIVVAVVALVAAVAGTAVAGPGASTSKITKKKVTKIADKEINKLAPGLSVAHANTANTADTANTATNATQLGGRGAAAFETASASDAQTGNQPMTGAEVPVLSANITVPSDKRLTATATIEATSNGGTDDNINCRLVIAGVSGPGQSTAVTPNTLEDSTTIPLTFSSVVGAGTHTVTANCNQGVGSNTTAQDRALTVVASG